MKALIIAVSILGAGAACNKERIKECDALVATAEKLEKCDKLDAASRTQIKSATKTIRDALQALDDVGGASKAEPAQIEGLRTTCQTQNESIIQLYEKVAPECLK
ncbi:MAG: hypothetical protein H0T89_02010 [Deltaproteobacteria bacterium]|nr:hypothetical protein [Deltaproteobacteria bacterium]MDQ3301610.1 hypothetical protein [Myxococcota bacterium]